MATTNFNNRLITPELTEALSSYPLYSQDAKKKDAMCIAVFYLGNIRWYIMEGQQEGNDFTLYGIVAGLQETEYGYQSATEMASSPSKGFVRLQGMPFHIAVLSFHQHWLLLSERFSLSSQSIESVP